MKCAIVHSHDVRNITFPHLAFIDRTAAGPYTVDAAKHLGTSTRSLRTHTSCAGSTARSAMTAVSSAGGTPLWRARALRLSRV